MEIEVRAVRTGDLYGMTKVILAARGYQGPELNQQVEAHVARFAELGLVEEIESNALIAHRGTTILGVLRYAVVEEEVHVMRPDIAPSVDAVAVTAVLLGGLWPLLAPSIQRAVFLDYPMPGAPLPTYGAVFEQSGFQPFVERIDMRKTMTAEPGPTTASLTFASYSDAVHERFLCAFRASFQASLDPMMEWDARHPEQSFAIFRDRFGVFHPDLWVLATDAAGQDVGFALFQYFEGGRYGGDVVLLYTAVLPGARGHGYGEQIVREGLRRVRQLHGAQAGVSLTVSAPNLPAKRIYERLGFAERSRFVVYRQMRITTI